MTPLQIDPALQLLGWTSFFHQQFLALLADDADLAERAPERIASDHGTEYGLLGSRGARRGVLSGRLVRELPDELRPCVGDFVLAGLAREGELCRIDRVFDRATVFRRKAAGVTSQGQAVAANVDVAIVVNALSEVTADAGAEQRGLNARRLERYLRACHDASVRALLVVSKADLRADADERARELARELGHPDVLAVSAISGQGFDVLSEHVGPGTTAVLVGSSGLGKSSLINRWLGRDAQRVQDVRAGDLRGRHTTTHRELFLLESGGVLIDTPGMREFGLFADERIEHETGFEDIDAIAKECRFRDCRHEREPGCAVVAAVERGELLAERLAHARKLSNELAWQRDRHDALKRRAEKQSNKVLSRAVREGLRNKGRDER
ncbi:MAG TPA: ribosome small subunit-dependent GTPase A [Polyangiaceae bacterium]